MQGIATQVIEESLYNAFWNKLQQFKFDIIYYSVHFNSCVCVARTIKYIIVGATAIATGAWMTWNNIFAISQICAIAILMLQGVSAISEWFPYEKRKNELRELIAELEPLYLEMESDWRRISRYEVDNDFVSNALQNYAKKQLKIKNHYLKDDALPEARRYYEKAERSTIEYFEHFI